MKRYRVYGNISITVGNFVNMTDDKEYEESLL